jgi:hypothetical protein
MQSMVKNTTPRRRASAQRSDAARSPIPYPAPTPPPGDSTEGPSIPGGGFDPTADIDRLAHFFNHQPVTDPRNHRDERHYITLQFETSVPRPSHGGPRVGGSYTVKSSPYFITLSDGEVAIVGEGNAFDGRSGILPGVFESLPYMRDGQLAISTYVRLNFPAEPGPINQPRDQSEHILAVLTLFQSGTMIIDARPSWPDLGDGICQFTLGYGPDYGFNGNDIDGSFDLRWGKFRRLLG